jgi:P4 family phage/plasmid primase-like protien
MSYTQSNPFANIVVPECDEPVETPGTVKKSAPVRKSEPQNLSLQGRSTMPSTPTIPVADINAAISLDPSSIKHIPIESIESVLRKGTGFCELVWLDSEEANVRAYLDIDGKVADDTDQADFEAMDTAIQFVLGELDLGTPFSLMTASRFNYNGKDSKGNINKKHKLSYRMTFTNKCGSKEAVKVWSQTVIAPKLKEALATTIDFYIKGICSKPADADQYLDWDSSVYRRGKIRCWNATKPNENRPNILIKGSPMDTLLTFIPEGCEVIEAPAPKPQPVRIQMPVSADPLVVAHPSDATEVALNPEKSLIVRVVQALPASVITDYNDWLSVGMGCFNEDIPLDVWNNWTVASGGNTYKTGDKRRCEAKWRTFKKGNITQAYLWSLLKREDPIKFKELQAERKDFIRLVESPTHYSVAEYFYNIRPHDYLFDSKGGWLGVLPSNVWESTDKQTPPSTMKNKITRSLNAERIQLEGVLIKKKRQAEEAQDDAQMKLLDGIQKKCLEFRDKIENASFQSGVTSFLSSFYGEQSQFLMTQKNITPGEGVISVFDTNPDIFAFSDCLYDFKTKDFRPIHPTDYITITCGYAKPKRNEAVRAKIMETLTGIWEDTEPRDYLLTLLAACLNGTRNAEVFAMLTGKGGNGKGLIWEMVMRTFGGYYYTLKKETLTARNDSATSATAEVAKMRGMRLVCSSEPEATEKLQEGIIKLFTGGDPITARMLYGQPTTFKPQFGLFVQSNNIPLFNQITKGGVRRNRVIPFPFNFVAEPKLSYERVGDPHIKNVLCRSDEWRDAFFHILLDYYPLAAGKAIDAIYTPPIVQARTDEYLEDNNKVGVWFKENYEVCEGEIVLSNTLLEDFKDDTKERFTASQLKQGLAFNDIDIVKISKGINKGRMGVVNYKRKEQTEVEAE